MTNHTHTVSNNGDRIMNSKEGLTTMATHRPFDLLANSQLDSTNSLPLLGCKEQEQTQALQQQQQQQHSVWQCETTPMTTRPHFDKYNETNSPASQTMRPMRRIRSRSLGSSMEHQHRHVLEGGSLLLPLIDWDVYDLRATPLSQYDRSCRPNTDLQPMPEIKKAFQLSAVSLPPVNAIQARLVQEASVQNQRIEQENPKDVVVDKEIHPELPNWVVCMYGMINATIVLPVLMSFGTIIYRDDAFAPYMPVLVKLTLVSGIVHQLCFSTFSSLPFAVGQVQDAGLIFLSGMASDMVHYCRLQGHDDETMLATVTVCLSLATACLGCGLVLIGYLNLAQYVQFLPTCVIGGYLAYIGWFCGLAGVGLMAGSSDCTFKTIMDNYHLIVPGIVSGFLIYLLVTKVQHVAMLPVSIVLELILFYAILWATKTTVEDATNNGWIRKIDQAPSWYHTWDYLKLSKVDWSIIPNLLATEIAMIFVVSLSSCLDVAAIEIELNRPLNYNHELKTVGISNIISGLSGGYTGSYIFSQSIFSLRAGIRSRLNGYVIAFCQLVVVILPIPLLSYVPNFFFGSLLSMICVDLMYEWLIDVRRKLTRPEYAICILTFAMIQALGVEYGILAGVGVHFACQKVGFDVGASKFTTHEVEASTETIHSANNSVEDLLLMEEVNNPSKTSNYGSL